MRGIVVIVLVMLVGCAGERMHQVQVSPDLTMDVDEATIRGACDTFSSVVFEGGQINASQLRLAQYGLIDGVCDQQSYLRTLRATAEAASWRQALRAVSRTCEQFAREGTLSGVDEWVMASFGWNEGHCDVPRSRLGSACTHVASIVETGGQVPAADVRLEMSALMNGIPACCKSGIPGVCD